MRCAKESSTRHSRYKNGDQALLLHRQPPHNSMGHNRFLHRSCEFVRQINIGTISVTVCRFTVKPSRFFIMTALTKALPVAFIPKQFIITSVRFDMVNHRSLNVFPVPLTNLAQRMFSKICLAWCSPFTSVSTLCGWASNFRVTWYMFLTISSVS